MKSLLMVVMILIGPFVWAQGSDRILCEAGIQKGHSICSTELFRQTRGSDDFMAGVLKFKQGVYEFSVARTQSGYQYQAKLKDDSTLIMDEAVPTLPSKIEVPLNQEESLFIICLPYTLADYCRMHTC